MKAIITCTLFLLLATAVPVQAASCGDSKNAAAAAIKERNEYATSAINTTMPDPEETRGPFSDCLSSINSIGASFTLGITLPSLDQIIEGLCHQADSMIQQKIQEVKSLAQSKIEEIGGNNPFQVSVGGQKIGLDMAAKLK
jgi:hypothetical protein